MLHTVDNLDGWSAGWSVDRTDWDVSSVRNATARMERIRIEISIQNEVSRPVHHSSIPLAVYLPAESTYPH